MSISNEVLTNTLSIKMIRNEDSQSKKKANLNQLSQKKKFASPLTKCQEEQGKSWASSYHQSERGLGIPMSRSFISNFWCWLHPLQPESHFPTTENPKLVSFCQHHSKARWKDSFLYFVL
jgi:hypothetical protein